LVDSISQSSHVYPIKFDKENELHLAIVSLLADIKCDCFHITTRRLSEKWRVQRIAGDSVPAIISSINIATALQCLNLYAVAGIAAGFDFKMLAGDGCLSGYNFHLIMETREKPAEINRIGIPSDLSLGLLKHLIREYFRDVYTERECDFVRLRIVFPSCVLESEKLSATDQDNTTLSEIPVRVKLLHQATKQNRFAIFVSFPRK
jgi:hypothetical protein